MVDDNLFEGGQDGDSQDTGKEGKGTPGVDHEALEKTISQSLEGSLAPVMGEIGKAIGGLNSKISQLEEGKGQGEGEGESTPGLSTEVEALLSKPDEVIAKHVANAREADAPLMQAVVRDRVDTHTKVAKASFDAEYGVGMYDEHMSKPVEGILQNYPPKYLVGADGVDSALTQVKGQNIELLMKLREETKVTAEKEKSSYNSIGSGRPDTDPKKGVDPEAKVILGKMQEAGFDDATEKSYAAIKSIPPTLSAYLKYKEGQKNAH